MMVYFFLNLAAPDDTAFLNKNIDIEDKTLNLDNSAFSVERNLPVLKVHFLLTFLNISHIYVTDAGALIGMISKEEFIKKSMVLNK